MKILQLSAGGLYSHTFKKEFESVGATVKSSDTRGGYDFTTPRVTADWGAFVSAIERMVKENEINNIYCHNQDELDALYKSKYLCKIGALSLSPPRAGFYRCTHKRALNDFLKLCGLPHQTDTSTVYVREIFSNKALNSSDRVLKPVTGCGSKGVIRTSTEEHTYFSAPRLSGKEFTVDLFTLDGWIISKCTRERVQAHGGICVEARVFRSIPQIDAVVGAFVRELKLTGPLAIQGFLAEEFTITDCNFRFGGGSPLSVVAGWAGMRNYVNSLTGNPIEPDDIRDGALVKREYHERIVECRSS